MLISQAFTQLLNYVESEQFKGYDPYDTLNSSIPFMKFGKWSGIIMTQVQKRNPFNIRSAIGIRKDYNAMGMGLLLSAYSLMEKKKVKGYDKGAAGKIFEWLKSNTSTVFTDASWGYNFGWVTSEKFLPANAPSSVVTGFVVRGLYDYYLISKNEDAAKLIHSAASFILNSIPFFEDESGLCLSYTPYKKDCVYNASLLAAEVLAHAYALSGEESLREKSVAAVNFVIAHQHEDGKWMYSKNLNTGEERAQIDFHQGYIIDSIKNIAGLTGTVNSHWENAISKGLNFYFTQQFFRDGRSLWRLPKEYPVDIHNQAQGIITFSDSDSQEQNVFAEIIATWTIRNMQLPEGGFFYRKNKLVDHKISYMRWNNAPMLLALTKLL